ncbi:MAG: aminodeoxychorismate synthase component I [Acidimicrobiales bacterium]|jgi:para-aminobenzoate synthetase/4-amino-4-deoxychorismate lyase
MDRSPTAVLRAVRGDARPFALFGSWSGGCALIGSDPLVVVEDADDPFAVVDLQPEIATAVPGTTGGGWVGYLGYALGGLVERLPSPPRRPVPLPSSILGFYDHVVTCDDSGNWWFEALWSDEQSERLEARLSEWRRRAGAPDEASGEYACGRFSLTPAPQTHLVAVSRAIEHIRSGDVFQVNVCARLEAGFDGDPLELFCTGADRLAPRFGAFLGHPSVAVASFSPELFLRRTGRSVLSSPIKGTVRRVGSPAPAREKLLRSGKDRAENLMIVDLVRNDLGRVCRYGTVAVPELWRAEEHPGVWHLVSDVTGELCDGVSDSDLLRATFPPGSVTGAPKVRAMELISGLEETAREVYTGAVGIASPSTGLELNVAIRTFELAKGQAWLGVGGGVVADSAPDRELEECFDKARPLLEAVGAGLGPSRRRSGRPQANLATRAGKPLHADRAAGVFETILVIGGRPVGLEAHLGRLAASISILYGAKLPARVGAQVMATVAGGGGSQRVRVLAYPGSRGSLQTEISISDAPEAFSGAYAPYVSLVPFVLAGGLGPHKWQDRSILADTRRSLGLMGGEQLLVVDADGVVLETERANIFAVCGGVLRTPPVDGRILAGTTREAVIRLAASEGFEVSQAPLAFGELETAQEVLLASSIRGVCGVERLAGSRSFEAGAVGPRLAKALWALWSGDIGQ